jgi:hypothetical protein
MVLPTLNRGKGFWSYTLLAVDLNSNFRMQLLLHERNLQW